MGTLSKSTGHIDLIEDETSCGPMCQHPSCWASNQRREKGFPLTRERRPSLTEDDLELPTVKVYNMLEDYGDDTRDRFPAKHSGRPPHHRLSASLPVLPKSPSDTSVRIHESIPAIMSSSTDSLQAKKQSRMKVVEVQEVFDVQDLNNKWDETFITRQYYVWVPNPSKTLYKPKTLDPLKNMSISKLTSQPQPIPSKDVTEQLIPEEVERQREETRVFDEFPVLKKKYANTHSGINRGNIYSRGPSQPRSARPYVDAESLNELLDLPREVLMSVLEHMEESDLTSKAQVQSVIKQFQQPPETHSPTSTSIGTSELLRQKKVRLLGSKEKNYRNPDLLMTKPVFQLDSGMEMERSSVVITPVKELASEPVSSREEGSLRELPKYKKPLPGIGTSAVSRSDGSTKIASISLGLPELPSGIRQTRPFTYKKQQYVDFSLGPVPTPPVTGRSSDTEGSDHGTTLRVNMASASTRFQEQDMNARYSREGTPMTESSLPLHGLSSSASGKLPKTPMVTPATHSSPTKMSFQRERTNNTPGQTATHSPPPSRDISMSPVQKMIAPANSPNQSPAHSPEPGTRGLVTIPEIMDDGSMRHVPAMGKMVSFVCEVPAPPPASLDEQHTYTISLSNPDHPPGDPHTQTRALSRKTDSADPAQERRTETEGRELYTRSSQSPISASSNEDWPNVDEAAFENAPYPHSTGLRSASDQLRVSSAERDSKTPASKARSSLASRESTKSSVTRMMRDESVKTESPGPPPPSPEPKKKSAEDRKSQELVSRESVNMAPLYEESEAGETNDPNSSGRYDPGVMTTVSKVTPQPKGGKREISVDTFVNVDIQASKESSKTEDNTAEQSTFRSEDPSAGMSATGDLTSRTFTGGYTTGDEESSPDAPFVLKTPVPEIIDDVTQDDNENRAGSGISRETTGLRKDTEPESINTKMDIEAVNYEGVGENKANSMPLSDGCADESEQPSAAPSPELKQETSLLNGEHGNSETVQMNVDNEIKTSELSDQLDGVVDRNVDASTPPEDEPDETGVRTSPLLNDAGAEGESTEGNNTSTLKPALEDMVAEPPIFEGKQKDDEDKASVKDDEKDAEGKYPLTDINVPPPVSRTNTAIEIVKSVIETASARMDDIQSGDSPDSQDNSQN